MAEGFVVVHHQHLPGGQDHLLAAVRGDLQVQGHLEAAALARLAGNGDAALHLVHDVFGDGHAQAGALDVLDPGVVLPREGIEDLFLELLGHADAGVLAPRKWVRTQFSPCSEGSWEMVMAMAPAFRGELQGVGEQIQQNLVQPHTVAVDLLLAGCPG